MISVQEAEQLLKENRLPKGTETIALDKSYGRILLENIEADTDLPPFHRVMMDGIAIRFQDCASGLSFKIIGIQKAGDDLQFLPHQGEAIEIMTGAILPMHFDTVVPYENITINEGIAVLQKVPDKVGQHIHTKGKDFKANDVLVEAPTRIGAAEIGVAASVGKFELVVAAQPSVAIISTGNELVAITDQPKNHQIRRSNDIVVHHLLRNYCSKIERFHLEDSLEKLNEFIKTNKEKFDIFIFIGGVSKGKFDFVAESSTASGFTTIFHRIAQKPGKPFLFSRDGEKFIFGLPGNPVSAMLCTCKYLLPWLSESTHLKDAPLEILLSEDFPAHKTMTLFTPVSYQSSSEKSLAKSKKNNGSGDFASLVNADGWAQLDAGQELIEKGSKVKFISLKP